MDPSSVPLVAAVLETAYSLLLALSDALRPFAGDESSALTILLVTVAVRLCLIPVGIAQGRAARDTRRLAPKLAELRRRHSRDRQLLQRKTVELYRAEGVSPLPGCLPALVQLPVVSIVYALFLLDPVGGLPNRLLGDALLGVPLGTRAVELLSSGAISPVPVALYLALFTTIGTAAWFSRREMIRVATPVEHPIGQQFATMAGLLPFASVVVAGVVPLAAAIYLAVTTVWTLLERTIVRVALDRSGG